jgi:hypothetical protein
MGKTFIRTFHFNYNRSSMDDPFTSLEEATSDYMKDRPNLTIKQIEFLWGDTYGARVAVLFEETIQSQEEEKDE